jgi:hypothetical protein
MGYPGEPRGGGPGCQGGNFLLTAPAGIKETTTNALSLLGRQVPHFPLCHAMPAYKGVLKSAAGRLVYSAEPGSSSKTLSRKRAPQIRLDCSKGTVGNPGQPRGGGP